MNEYLAFFIQRQRPARKGIKAAINIRRVRLKDYRETYIVSVCCVVAECTYLTAIIYALWVL